MQHAVAVALEGAAGGALRLGVAAAAARNGARGIRAGRARARRKALAIGSGADILQVLPSCPSPRSWWPPALTPATGFDTDQLAPIFLG